MWTYNGKQATFTSGGTTLDDNVWGNPSAASTVSEVTGPINKQDTLPVLCFVGEEYVRGLAWQ